MRQKVEFLRFMSQKVEVTRGLKWGQMGNYYLLGIVLGMMKKFCMNFYVLNTPEVLKLLKQ